MTKRAPTRVRRRLAVRRSSAGLPGLLALGLVLLQLVTALHFALIPHGFNAGFNGFEHVHRAFVGRIAERATEHAPSRPTLVIGVPSCAPDACPIGFSGPVSALLAPAALTARVALAVAIGNGSSASVARCRAQLLLAAPKTSPPRRV